MLFLRRLLTRITSATYAIANALIADVSAPEDKAQNFGLLGVAFGLGFIAGPPWAALSVLGIYAPPSSSQRALPLSTPFTA